MSKNGVLPPYPSLGKEFSTGGKAPVKVFFHHKTPHLHYHSCSMSVEIMTAQHAAF